MGSVEDKSFNEPRLVLNRIIRRPVIRVRLGLVGGQRVAKDAPRIDCYGTVDELNSFIGMACFSAEEAGLGRLVDILRRVQHELFNLGSILGYAAEDVHPSNRALLMSK